MRHTVASSPILVAPGSTGHPHKTIIGAMVSNNNDDPGPHVAAVLAVVHEFEQALDRGDVEAVTRLCLDDFVFFGSGEGEEATGAAALAPMLAALRAGVAAAMVSWDLVLDDGHHVVVRGDTARVTAAGRFELVMPGSTRAGRYLLTGVLRRTSEGWRWWAFHGSEPQPW